MRSAPGAPRDGNYGSKNQVTKTMRQILIAAALAVTWAGDASAAMTRTELQELCRPISMATDARSRKQFADLTQCMGYIIGVLDTAGFYNRLKPDTCVPPETERGTLVRVVLDYLDKTPPEKAFGLAGLLVETALWKAYPCPK